MRMDRFSLILSLASAAAAQTPRPTVIRTETRMVLVDAVVTDKTGKSVRDLTAKDFHVWEDSKEQTIQSAAFVANPTAAPAPTYLVLFFDDASLTAGAQSRARDAAVQFIEANAGPNRFMAIANYGGAVSIAQNFTTDTDRLKRIAAQEFLGAEMDTAPAIAGRGISTSSQAAAAGSGGAGFALGLRLLAANLASVPGRKNVVVFSQGFPFSPQMDAQLRSAVAECNRNDVVLYPMLFRPASDDPTVVQAAAGRGGRARSGGQTDMAVAPSTQSLGSLATGTGGFVYDNPNDLLAGLMKIGREQTDYYLLGYTPVESPEGSCHPLKVKVDRPGISVRARASYCNVKAVDLLAGKPVEQDLEYRMTGDQPGTITASMQVPFFYTEADTVRLNVAMEIPSNGIRFEKVKGKSHAELNIVGIAYLPDGSAAARFSDTVKLDFATQKELDAFHARPLHYEKEFFAAPGTYKLKVAFTAGGEAFGKLEAPLTIEPYDGKQFMLSGLALSKEVHPASDLGSAQDAELLEGRTPLIYKDVKVIPSGSNQFHKTDPLIIFGEVYEPLLAGATPPIVELRMQIVDKAGVVKNTGAIRPEIAPNSGRTVLPFALKLKVDTLEPGVYRADVEAVDSAGKTMLRSVNFEMK